MANKPIKFSDLDKGWIKSRQDRRKTIFPEYHLIICEGEKTEPNYFRKLSEMINTKYKGRIILEIKGKAKGTLQLLEEAKKEHDKSNKEIRNVWIVYDKDDFPKDNFDNTFYKCNNMIYKGATYHALWSNECIELWFLLHFKYIEVAHNRNEYKEMLNDEFRIRNLGQYYKNSEDTCLKLLEYTDVAIENAKKLDRLYEEQAPWQRNPSTKVYQLIEILKKYL